ncbi:hypothetical protein FEM03_07765 [Phragmitibacter flavus]|uniref:Uncharacterized protein n=1 Tax=Phragmitibacter flavus TaxID=2576071 RepID=A0A5R8KHF8_9BACT|nr:hypothetical protein [Phragmitibacter flavus]TLD71415.1 hypothetical protein FEM03_07765 [Phragmitibacter flavus]
MQRKSIILIPPTHEQTVTTFHAEKSVAQAFLDYLKQNDVTPWRPPEEPEKSGPDGLQVVQIEVETSLSQERLQELMDTFLASARTE